MYLIVKTIELMDGWECDAERTPMYVTEDWKNNYPIDYPFEVWEINADNTLKCIKDYDEPFETGMVYGYYDFNEDSCYPPFHLIEKFKGRTDKEPCPKHILKLMKKLSEFENSLKNAGYITAYKTDMIVYIYGEYSDSRMPICW